MKKKQKKTRRISLKNKTQSLLKVKPLETWTVYVHKPGTSDIKPHKAKQTGNILQYKI